MKNMQTDCESGEELEEQAEAAEHTEAVSDPENTESTENTEQETETSDESAAEPEAPEQTEAKDESADKKEKSGFFKKKKDKKDEQIEELNDKLKRQMAEFDNFRKRSEKEKSQMFDMGARTIVEKILPVVDNFERGFTAVGEDKKEDAFVSGMDKVYKQLMTELENMGVKPIEAVGKEFDPNFHNAVMQVESEEYESGVVAQELQKGYMYKDTVVRHSMVAVVS